VRSVAHDGYVVAIPLELVANTDVKKVAGWLVIELPDQPWPLMPPPHSPVSAAPFRLVWTGQQVDQLPSKYWSFYNCKI